MYKRYTYIHTQSLIFQDVNSHLKLIHKDKTILPKISIPKIILEK